MIRIWVVSPVLAVRAGLRALLSAERQPAGDGGPVVEVVGESTSVPAFEGPGDESSLAGTDVLLAAGDRVPLQDLSALAAAHPGRLALLLLTDEPEAVPLVSRYGWRAWGVLPFDCSTEELLAALQAVYQGLLVGSPALAQPSLLRLLGGESGPPEPLVEPLTERELEVLQLLSRGLANKQIAVQLNISEHTVKFHVSSLYGKLEATNRTEAVRIGVQRGLIVL